MIYSSLTIGHPQFPWVIKNAPTDGMNGDSRLLRARQSQEEREGVLTGDPAEGEGPSARLQARAGPATSGGSAALARVIDKLLGSSRVPDGKPPISAQTASEHPARTAPSCTEMNVFCSLYSIPQPRDAPSCEYMCICLRVVFSVLENSQAAERRDQSNGLELEMEGLSYSTQRGLLRCSRARRERACRAAEGAVREREGGGLADDKTVPESCFSRTQMQFAVCQPRLGGGEEGSRSLGIPWDAEWLQRLRSCWRAGC